MDDKIFAQVCLLCMHNRQTMGFMMAQLWLAIANTQTDLLLIIIILSIKCTEFIHVIL